MLTDIEGVGDCDTFGLDGLAVGVTLFETLMLLLTLLLGDGETTFELLGVAVGVISGVLSGVGVCVLEAVGVGVIPTLPFVGVCVGVPVGVGVPVPVGVGVPVPVCDGDAAGGLYGVTVE